MKLQHYASFDIAELPQILEVDTLEAFVKNVVKFGRVQDSDIYEPLKYMGDCWEVFAEFFFKFFNGDHTLTYTANYEPNLGEDKGIDGRGISTLDGGPNVVQNKFKADLTKWLTDEDRISNVAADSTLNEGLIPNGKNIIVFTSCRGVHPNHAMVNAYCINGKQIARRVNKNVVFWNDFRQSIATQE